jgi:hypothetical protein
MQIANRLGGFYKGSGGELRGTNADFHESQETKVILLALCNSCKSCNSQGFKSVLHVLHELHMWSRSVAEVGESKAPLAYVFTQSLQTIDIVDSAAFALTSAALRTISSS